MKKRTFPGINIQWPISELIIEGAKTIETRTYPLPDKYLNREMVLVETPGRAKNFSARIIAIIKFTDCFLYKDKKDFYLDADRHKVTPDSPWAWRDKPKWGWTIQVLKVLEEPQPLNRRPGRIYSQDLAIHV